MAAHTLEINDSDTIAAALLSSRVPTTVTNGGDAVGVFYPMRRPWTDADRIAFHQDTEKMQQMMLAADVTEDEIVEDFMRMREIERAKLRS